MLKLEEVAERYKPPVVPQYVSYELPQSYSCDVCGGMMMLIGTPVYTYLVNAPMGDAAHLCTTCHRVVELSRR
jgi:hypothetical protein